MQMAETEKKASQLGKLISDNTLKDKLLAFNRSAVDQELNSIGLAKYMSTGLSDNAAILKRYHQAHQELMLESEKGATLVTRIRNQTATLQTIMIKNDDNYQRFVASIDEDIDQIKKSNSLNVSTINLLTMKDDLENDPTKRTVGNYKKIIGEVERLYKIIVGESALDKSSVRKLEDVSAKHSQILKDAYNNDQNRLTSLARIR